MTMADSIDWTSVRTRLADAQRSLDAAFGLDDDRLQALMRERTQRLAALRASSGQSLPSIRVLVVHAGGERYGLDLGRLSGVRPLGACTPAPRGPRSLLGLVTASSGIWAIFDFAQLCGIEGELTASGYAVLLRHDTRRIGLRVEQLDRVHVVRHSDIRPTSESNAITTRFIKGVTSEGLIVVDIQALWDHTAIGEAM